MTYQQELALERVIQNLKLIILMKSSGATDRDVARQLDMQLNMYVNAVEGDEYLREKIGNAEMSYAVELEAKFKEVAYKKLEEGDTTDAKWYMERTIDKYKKTDKVDITIRSIDDIIRGLDMNTGGELDDK